MERIENERICEGLELFVDVFLPQRDGELIQNIIDRGYTAEDAYGMVFRHDTVAIAECDALVINLDGRTVDEGAAFELGMAYANGKLCIGYHTDIRLLLPWGLNPMVVGPLSNIFNNRADLFEWARRFGAGIYTASPQSKIDKT